MGCGGEDEILFYFLTVKAGQRKNALTSEDVLRILSPLETADFDAHERVKVYLGTLAEPKVYLLGQLYFCAPGWEMGDIILAITTGNCRVKY